MSNRPLRVVFDARSVVPRQSGIGNYEAALLRHMVELSPDTHFTVLRNPLRTSAVVDGPNVKELRIPGETKSFRTLLLARDLRRIGPFDLYHSPADIIPLGVTKPWVVTIHDLMWEEAPHLASAFLPVRIVNGVWYRANFARSIRGAARVIAISEATAAALRRLHPSIGPRVSVVRHGIEGQRFRSVSGLSRQQLDDYVPAATPYVLLVGQGSPYKNHLGMVRAFLRATRALPDHKLVLIRRFSRVDRDMQRLLARPDVRERVIVHSFVPQDVLFSLYRHAQALLFLSHYEGFGMPAIEAMALGVPVVASTAAAVREVTGNAALHANAASVEQMAVTIRDALLDSDLRERLSDAGKRQAAEFTWYRAARQTLQVYRDAMI